MFRRETKRSNRERKPSARWRPRGEHLEARYLLDGGGLVWNDTSQLTLSFVPDGTDIGGESSALFEQFDDVASSRQWKDTILQAFQTWAVHTQVNVGVVNDAGFPMGTPGPRTEDPRFGDIRIGSRPLAGDVLAIGVSQNSVVAGTWAGDVIFNSEASIGSLEDLFAVALHEAGHVFGLDESDDPASPMHSHGLPTSSTLTPEDIDRVQELHGDRLPDQYEPNNSFRTPTRLVDPTPGQASKLPPILMFGDLTTRDDVDYFMLPINRQFSGKIEVRVQSAGISLLAPHVRVLNSDGSEVGRSSSPSADGATVMVQLNDADPRERYFIEVSSARGDVFAIGAYSLVVSFASIPQVDTERVDDVVVERSRELTSDQVQSLLRNPRALLNLDLANDDDPSGAKDLASREGLNTIERFAQVGSISQKSDIDYYRFATQSEPGNNVLNLTVRPLRPGTLIPEATLFDSRRQVVPTETLVNGNGELVLQARLEPGQHYFIRVAAEGADGPLQVGNYRILLSLVDEWVEMAPFMKGQLNDESPNQVQALYIARPQLFHFAIDTHSVRDRREGNQAVFVNFWDSDREVLTRVSSPVNATRSSHGILLMPGTYAVQVFSSVLGDRIAQPAEFLLRGTTFSDPFGIDPNDPTEYFQCPDEEELFCYPGGVISDDPFLWDEFLDNLPDIPDLDLSEMVAALLGDWWSWYWNTLGENGPILTVEDDYETEVETALVVDSENGVLANDIDPENGYMAAFLVTTPAHGSIDLNTDGSFSYVPDSGFAGIDQFTYLASDFIVDSELATVEISVIGDVTLPGDFNDDLVIDIDDVELLHDVIRTGTEDDDQSFDLNNDELVDLHDMRYMIGDILGSFMGDSNLDGGFGSTDLIVVFQSGHYENPAAGWASWASGDWNCDGVFDTSDLIVAFQDGGYSENYATSAVLPDPDQLDTKQLDPSQFDEDQKRKRRLARRHGAFVV